jgi:type I restriction enzyme, S subunit
MSFPRYPQYKDSGVEWLGDVPGHWEVTALKRGFNVTLGKMLQPESSNPDDALLPYLRAANIQWSGVESTDIKQMWLSKRDRTQLRLEHGDLLVSEGGDVGRSCLWASELEDCYFQNSVNRVRARHGHSNRYLYYWISTVKDKGYIDVLCNKSTIAHFTAEKVAAVPVPLPTPDEQTQIAAFLDRETAKIDALVAQQRRLMELLKEKRQAVISHAVTQGLNPQAPMKPSGIEWLGDVPAHWDVCSLKYHVTTVNGFGFSSADFQDEGVPFIRAGNIKNKSITQPAVFLPKEVVAKYRRVWLATGDIVISMVGSDPEVLESAVGQVGIVPDSLNGAVPNQNIVILRENQTSLLRRYLFFTVCSAAYRNHLNVFSHNLANQSIISSSLLVCAKFSFPERAEQEQIVEFLDLESAKFDTLTGKAQRAIDLLRERRTALISAAVTGQIDVRSAI